jgi:hypothetical protein
MIIAEVDTDPNFDSSFLGQRALQFAHPLLGLAGAAHRRDRGRELNQRAVLGGLDDAPALCGNLWIDQFAPKRLQPLKRSRGRRLSGIRAIPPLAMASAKVG